MSTISKDGAGFVSGEVSTTSTTSGIVRPVGGGGGGQQQQQASSSASSSTGSLAITATGITDPAGGTVRFGELENYAGSTMVFRDGRRFVVMERQSLGADPTLCVCLPTAANPSCEDARACANSNVTWNDLYQANRAIVDEGKTSEDDVRGRCLLLQLINDRLGLVRSAPPACSSARSASSSGRPRFTTSEFFANPEQASMETRFFMSPPQRHFSTTSNVFYGCCDEGQTPRRLNDSACLGLVPEDMFRSAPCVCPRGKRLLRLTTANDGVSVLSAEPSAAPQGTTRQC